jgi:hypothetical protein
VSVAAGGPSINTALADCYAASLPAPDDQDKGLLGNLPSRRPSVESPRRAEARLQAAERSEAEDVPAAPAGAEQGGAPGLEDLARAGTGLALDAAGIGLRLAGRAVGRIGRLAGRD